MKPCIKAWIVSHPLTLIGITIALNTLAVVITLFVGSHIFPVPPSPEVGQLITYVGQGFTVLSGIPVIIELVVIPTFTRHKLPERDDPTQNDL